MKQDVVWKKRILTETNINKQRNNKANANENENASALTNIAKEDDSNIFKLVQNYLWIINIRFVILKRSRFCLFVTFIFMLVLLYTQMFFRVGIYLLKVNNRNTLYYSSPLIISFWYFFQPPSLLPCYSTLPPPSPPSPLPSPPASIRDLRVEALFWTFRISIIVILLWR